MDSSPAITRGLLDSSADSARRSRKRWRWRTIYAALAVPVAAGAPLGWLAVSWFLDGGEKHFVAWCGAEIVDHAVLYGYLELSTTIVLVSLGWFLGRLTDWLELESLTDALTGLHNRRYFEARMIEEMARARRYGTPLALIVIDVDDFKSINDRRGHDVGDALLKRVARHIRSAVRSSDIAARPAGDEFVVLLPETDIADAATLCERLRATAADELGGTTLSIGGGAFNKEAHDRPRDFFRAVDRALYTAKGDGKNCVRFTP